RKMRHRYEARRLVEVTDALGRKSAYRYDASGRLAGMTLPRGQSLAFDYASDGTLAAVTGPGASRTTFEWRMSDDQSGVELIVDGSQGREILRMRPSHDAGAAPGDPASWALEIEATDAAGSVSSARVSNDRVTVQREGWPAPAIPTARE